MERYNSHCHDACPCDMFKWQENGYPQKCFKYRTGVSKVLKNTVMRGTYGSFNINSLQHAISTLRGSQKTGLHYKCINVALLPIKYQTALLLVTWYPKLQPLESTFVSRFPPFLPYVNQSAGTSNHYLGTTRECERAQRK